MIKTIDKNFVKTSSLPVCSYSKETTHSGVKVYADNKEVVVYSSSDCDFVKIYSTGFVNVKVEYDKKIESAVIRPVRFGRKIEFSDNIATFCVNRGDYLCVEFNEDVDRPLFVFVDEKIEFFDYANYEVLYFEDNKTYETNINITKDNTVVYVGENTIVRGGIVAENVKNIKIIGNGIIDATKVLDDPLRVDGTSTERRPRGCVFVNCENIEINGIVSMCAGTWITDFENCKNVRIENYKMLGDVICSDGIDIFSTQNVYIHHAFVRNEDDCLCIKSGAFEKCPHNISPVKNVYVSDCVLWSNKRGNAIEIGYELMEDVSDVIFKDIDVIHRFTQDHKFNRSVLSVHNAGKANVKNVLYENIYVEHSDENLVMLSNLNKKTWGNGKGSIKDITYRNIHLLGGKVNPTSYISTNVIDVDAGNVISDEKRVIDNILFENVHYKGTKIDSIETARKLGFTISDDIDIKFL